MSLVFLILLIIGTVIHMVLIGYFAIGQLRAFRYFDSRLAHAIEKFNDNLSVSLIIPLHNESQNVEMLMDSLKKLKYNSEKYEIILVDDKSTDNTLQLLKWHAPKLSGTVRILQSDRKPGWAFKKRAIHQAVEKARNDIIVLTDADVILPENWLRETVWLFEKSGADMIPGVLMPNYQSHESPFIRFQALDFGGLVAMGIGAFGHGKPFLCNGANLAFRRQAYIDINGFKGYEQITSGDDVFLLQKMKLAGKKIGWNLKPDSIVQTNMKSTLASFLKQRIRWASKNHLYNSRMLVFLLLLEVLYFPIFVLSLFFLPPTYIIPFFGLKVLVDLLLLKPFFERFDAGGNLIRSILGAELFQFFYIPLVLMGMVFDKGDW